MPDLNSLAKSSEINSFQQKALLLVRDISHREGVEVVGTVFPADDNTYVKCSCEEAAVDFFLYNDGANLKSEKEDRLFEAESYSDLSSLMRSFLECFERAVARKTAT